MSKKVLGAVLVLFLAGCGPAISPNLLRQAGPAVNFADLAATPEKFQGSLVVLGGEVMSVKPQDGGSLLQVDQMPLDAQMRPVDKSASGGTLAVASDHWLAPDDYVPRRKVTVAGVVQGRQDGAPLIKAQQIYLWEHPFKLVAVPPAWYDYDPVMEYWYTPPYFDPWRPSPR
jgi:starvation-inducible outer membrane lipoprotein